MNVKRLRDDIEIIVVALLAVGLLLAAMFWPHATHPQRPKLPVNVYPAIRTRNWAAYESRRIGHSTGITAQWNVPRVTCKGVKNFRWSASWVGLNDSAKLGVQQTGTFSLCDGSTPDYAAWSYDFPHGHVKVYRDVVNSGDLMFASVTFTAPSIYSVQLLDQTQGWIETEHYKLNAAPQAAEVVQEDPARNPKGTAFWPMANFGRAVFKSIYMLHAKGLFPGEFPIEMIDTLPPYNQADLSKLTCGKPPGSSSPKHSCGFTATFVKV